MVECFKNYYVEIKLFKANLIKDNQQRRESLDIVTHKLGELDRIESEFEAFKTSTDEQEPDLVQKIEKVLKDSRETLIQRLNTIKQAIENMADKFDLRTAASLLPIMDNTENSTKQLIDAIKLYNDLLDNDGKRLLIRYVLSTRLSENAKLRLNSTYVSVNDLVRDMQTHLLTKKSAATLSTELHNVKQYGKSVEDFGKNIEQLFVDLTIAEADGDEARKQVLQAVNEKLAINAFCNGLKNHDLRTIVKARGYETLKDAINGAKNESKEMPSANPQVFHSRGRFNSKRGRFQNRGRFQSNRYNNNNNRNNNNHSNSNQNQNSQYQQNYSYRGQGRGRGNYRNRDFTPRNRGRGNNSRSTYVAETNSNTDQGNEVAQADNDNNMRFFRA